MISLKKIFLLFFFVLFVPLLQAEESTVHEIPYKVTSKMFNAQQNKVIDTPAPMLEKIRKVFDLWESASEAHLKFKFSGLAKEGYSKIKDIPSDGTIYIVLNGQDSSGEAFGVAGEGSYEGKIPYRYQKGYAILLADRGLYTLSTKSLIHEIGHALGLSHAATLASVMTCGTPAWSDYEVFFISEQDRADLARLWNPSAVFTISGTIETKNNRKEAYVYAVNIENGHTYSAMTDTKGNFILSILKAGEYKIFTKGNEGPAFNNDSVQGPGWYKADRVATLDPDQAKFFSLNKRHAEIEGLHLKMNEESPGFNFFWSTSDKPPVFNPAFMEPGTSGEFNLLFNQIKGQKAHPVSVESFGTHPDYHVELIPNDTGDFKIKVSIDAGAEEGERLVVARGSNGKVQAGLVGIHVAEKRPQFLLSDPRNMNQSIQDELDGKIDLSVDAGKKE